MSDKVKDELIQLAKSFEEKTFSGEAIGYYYPANCQNAYYRMSYTPTGMVLRHKSPSCPNEERFYITYRGNGDYECNAITVFIDDKILWSCFSEEEINGKIRKFILGGLKGFLFKYLYNDPRVIFQSAESWEEISPPQSYDKAYLINAYNGSFDPNIGVSLIAELYLKDSLLKMMKLRVFNGRDEVTSQTMEVIFEYCEVESSAKIDMSQENSPENKIDLDELYKTIKSIKDFTKILFMNRRTGIEPEENDEPSERSPDVRADIDEMYKTIGSMNALINELSSGANKDEKLNEVIEDMKEITSMLSTIIARAKKEPESNDDLSGNSFKGKA
jgi:hypothetical protein